MRGLLGDEAEPFLAAFALPAPTGLRLNPLRGEPTRLARALPWALDPVPWCDTGRVVAEPPDSDDAANVAVPRPSLHPYHHAGVYYLQDPAAMAVAEAVAPRPGDRVLDLAAAPGGKSTHLAGMLAGRGLLVANDVEAGRVEALVGNLERLGVTNAMVTRERPERLARAWPGWFDHVLLDAPCSGEGMFRKNPDAARHWSEAHVLGCARRQDELLDAAAELVRPGGTLTYATCTFAPEENEGAVARFLARHTNFALTSIDLPGGQPGRPEWNDPPDARLTQTVRIWAHRSVGEGHFVARLQRASDDAVPPTARVRSERPTGDMGVVLAAWRAFAHAALTEPWRDELQPSGLHGGRLLAYPDGLPPLGGVHVVRAGLHLATVRPGSGATARRATASRAGVRHDRRSTRTERLETTGGHLASVEPAHALAMALPAEAVVNRLSLAAHDPRVDAYLAGDHLDLQADETAGWSKDTPYVRVEVDGFPLGWGRSSGKVSGSSGADQASGPATVRSLLPKGLRRVG